MRMPCRACFMPEDAWNIYSRYSFSTALWAPGNEKRATEKTNSRLNITILWYPLAALKTYFAYVFQTEMMISQDFTKRDTDVRWCQDAPEFMKYPLRHISYKRIFKKLKTLEDRYPFVGRSTAWAHPGPESCHHLEPESGVIPEAFTGYKGRPRFWRTISFVWHIHSLRTFGARILSPFGARIWCWNPRSIHRV